MRLIPHIPCLLLLAVTTACKTRTESTVVAGPQSMALGFNDYNPEREAMEREAVASGSANAMVGVQGQGGAGFQRRFGSENPYGYTTSPMQDKMFGGVGDAKKPDRMYHDRRSFLTRRYTGTKELKKDSYKGVKSTHWEDRLFATEETPYGDQAYSDSGRRVATDLNRDAGRMAGVKNYREGDRRLPARMNYAAEKALAGGAEEPAMRDAGAGERNTVKGIVGGHAPGERATIAEIRAFIGNDSP